MTLEKQLCIQGCMVGAMAGLPTVRAQGRGWPSSHRALALPHASKHNSLPGDTENPPASNTGYAGPGPRTCEGISPRGDIEGTRDRPGAGSLQAWCLLPDPASAPLGGWAHRHHAGAEGSSQCGIGRWGSAADWPAHPHPRRMITTAELPTCKPLLSSLGGIRPRTCPGKVLASSSLDKQGKGKQLDQGALTCPHL